MMTEACKNCLFFKAYEKWLNQPGYGYCRRHPPTVKAELPVTKKYNLNMIQSFPFTHQEQFCGEFQWSQQKT